MIAKNRKVPFYVFNAISDLNVVCHELEFLFLSPIATSALEISSRYVSTYKVVRKANAESMKRKRKI